MQIRDSCRRNRGWVFAFWGGGWGWGPAHHLGLLTFWNWRYGCQGEREGVQDEQTRSGRDCTRATHVKFRPQPSDPQLSHAWQLPRPEGAPPPCSQYRPPWGKYPGEQGQGHGSGVTPPPSQGATGLHPSQAAFCRSRLTRGATLPQTSPSPRSFSSGRGAPDFLDSFCASETELPPGLAGDSLHRAPPRGDQVRSGRAGAPDEWGSPPPQGARGAAASLTSPKDCRQMGCVGQTERPLKLTAAPSPKQRRPSNAPAL